MKGLYRTQLNGAQMKGLGDRKGLGSFQAEGIVGAKVLCLVYMGGWEDYGVWVGVGVALESGNSWKVAAS